MIKELSALIFTVTVSIINIILLHHEYSPSPLKSVGIRGMQLQDTGKYKIR